MKGISFLGKGDYQEVTYVWGERAFTTHLFPEAMVRLFELERLFLLVTEEAKTAAPRRGGPPYLDSLKERLGPVLQVVEIPDGRSEEELWQVFRRMGDLLEEGEEVVLDVTHAFRSLPLVAFTAALYLRRVRRVSLRRIVYGVYEARQGNRAPVFDLTPLLDLVDWLEGAAFFLERGDALPLAQRLREAQARPYRALGESRGGAGEALPTRLQRAASLLEGLSQALHLARPLEVMERAQVLLPLLEEVGREAERWALPFTPLLDDLKGVVTSLAHGRPRALDRDSLGRQLQLLRLYLRWGALAQAALLAREWLVSWTVLERGGGDWLEREVRGGAARMLNEAQEALRRGEEPDLSRAAVELWGKVHELRNQVAHCGLGPNPARWEALRHTLQELVEGMEALLREAPEGVLVGGRVVVDVRSLYGETARLEELPFYVQRALEMAGEGKEVVLTGQGPIWLYLALAHALHGKARRLLYASPTTGEVTVFDHTP